MEQGFALLTYTLDAITKTSQARKMKRIAILFIPLLSITFLHAQLTIGGTASPKAQGGFLMLQQYNDREPNYCLEYTAELLKGQERTFRSLGVAVVRLTDGHMRYAAGFASDFNFVMWHIGAGVEVGRMMARMEYRAYVGAPLSGVYMRAGVRL